MSNVIDFNSAVIKRLSHRTRIRQECVMCVARAAKPAPGPAAHRLANFSVLRLFILL
jgi:hypothetical protein